MGEDETKLWRKYTVLLPPQDFRDLTEIATARGEDNVAGVTREAISRYIALKKNPQGLAEEMKRLVKSDPSILKEAIAAEVREQVQIQLRQIFGTK